MHILWCTHLPLKKIANFYEQFIMRNLYTNLVRTLPQYEWEIFDFLPFKACLISKCFFYTITCSNLNYVLTPLQKKYPVDFDDELKIGDVRYDNMT